MSEYKVDLAQWYAEGRWGALLDLIDMLPTASRLNEAKMDDPELAELLAAQPAPSEAWSPRISENTLTTMILAQISDRLQEVTQTIVGTSGGSPSQIKPFPTPRTAVDRFKAEQDRRWAEAEVMRWGFDPSDI